MDRGAWRVPTVQSVSSVTQLCPTLCNARNCSPPGSSVHGIFQTRILEWVAISYAKDLPKLGIKPESPVYPALANLYHCATWEAQ